jgi:hypothetical protein
MLELEKPGIIGTIILSARKKHKVVAAIPVSLSF